MFNNFSKELNVNGKLLEILEKYFEYTKKLKKMIENEFQSQIKDYRDIDEKEKTNYINKKINKLPIHEKLRKSNLNDVMMDFDATSLYPSAMWDKNSVYLKIEAGIAFKPHMNKTYADAFNYQIFNQDGNEPAILRKKYYNSPNLIFQHLPVNQSQKKMKILKLKE